MPHAGHRPTASTTRALLTTSAAAEGTMSEYICLLRKRGLAARHKAGRGALRFTLRPAFLGRGRSHRARSRRSGEVSTVVREFRRAAARARSFLGRARHRSACPRERNCTAGASPGVPRLPRGYGFTPIYAGAYALAQHQTTRIVDGRAVTTEGHQKAWRRELLSATITRLHPLGAVRGTSAAVGTRT